MFCLGLGLIHTGDWLIQKLDGEHGICPYRGSCAEGYIGEWECLQMEFCGKMGHALIPGSFYSKLYNNVL